MKILLANKYYYLKGGDCTYFLETEKLLRQHGHDVAVFTMQHPNNYQSSYSKYFPSEVDFSKGGIANSIKSLSRPLFSFEVKSKFEKLLNDFNPDVIHFNNIHSQLSPLLGKIAKSRGIPVIWTQHDYKALCPAYICTRDYEPCELCFDNKFNVIKHKCIKGSLPASMLAFAESKIWNKDVLESFTYRFVCPSEFIQRKMLQAGFDKKKVINRPYFINPDNLSLAETTRKSYYCYVGRLVKEKGLETLLAAAMNFPTTELLIIGTGPLEEELRSKYQANHIKFLGYRKWPEIEPVVRHAKFMVVPSEWYENYPLSIIESLSLGTPVLGSNAGGIPEMIIDGFSGLTFTSRDVNDLKEKLAHLLSSDINFDYEAIQKHALEKYSAENHYDWLIQLYCDAIDRAVELTILQ